MATLGTRSAKIGTGLIALAFIFLFVMFWGGLLLRVFTADEPVTLAEHQETILAFLATTIATGTAAVLGINVVNLTSKERRATRLSGPRPRRPARRSRPRSCSGSASAPTWSSACSSWSRGSTAPTSRRTR